MKDFLSQNWLKIIIGLSLVILIFFLPNFSLAISGACSSHWGVNCSVFDTDGSVICNDGWKDSSTGYYSTDECNICSSYFYHTGCKNKYDLDIIRNDYGRRGLSFSGMMVQAENQCNAEIQEYEAKQVKYQQCENFRLESLKLQSDYFDTKLKQLLEQQTINTIPQCPPNSSYNGTTGDCPCNVGYKVSGNTCITYTQICQKQFGVNSYGDSQYCYCSTGYQWDTSRTSCVIIPTPVCPQNASAVGNSCICKTGFVLRNNQCVSYTDDCELAYGTNVVGVAGPNNNSNCDCVAGYEWDGARTGCVLKKSVIHLPTQAFEAETPKLTSEIKTTPEVIKIPEKTPNKEQVMGKQTLVGELKSGGYIRTCPLITCSAFGVAYEGEKISILNIDDSKEWYSIEALDGTTNKYFSGWIHYSLFTEDLRSYFDNKLINTKGHNKDLKKIEMGTSTPPPSIAEVSTTTEKITPKTSFFKKIWKFIWRF